MKHLTTENRNEATMHLDEMSIEDALTIMNEEDQRVPQAIKQVIPTLSNIINLTATQFSKGGRLIYMGAGTSGRLGVLDAAECVPTFNTEPTDIIGLIAGGEKAMTTAIEGSEDNETLGATDLKDLALTSMDVVIGIAASGRTPYVIGGLQYAQSIGAQTVAISCNTASEISKHADYPLEVNVGPEVLTGSTRLKSGTAQKLILNMISTITMVRCGKVYDNLMIDVRSTNEKLVHRAIGIIQDICDINSTQAQQLYDKANQNLKVAVVMHLCNIDKSAAEAKLSAHNGVIKQAIQS